MEDWIVVTGKKKTKPVVLKEEPVSIAKEEIFNVYDFLDEDNTKEIKVNNSIDIKKNQHVKKEPVIRQNVYENKKLKINEKAWTHLYLMGKFCNATGEPLYKENPFHTLLAKEYQNTYNNMNRPNTVHKMIQINKQVDGYINNDEFLHKYWMGQVYTSDKCPVYETKENGLERAKIYQEEYYRRTGIKEKPKEKEKEKQKPKMIPIPNTRPVSNTISFAEVLNKKID